MITKTLSLLAILNERLSHQICISNKTSVGITIKVAEELLHSLIKFRDEEVLEDNEPNEGD